MGSEQKEISFSESFQEAIDRCCEAQVECTTQMAKVTCDVWSKAMACYVVGVTKGLGGIVKCYIAGVECFYKTLETVAEDLQDKEGKEAKFKSSKKVSAAARKKAPAKKKASA